MNAPSFVTGSSFNFSLPPWPNPQPEDHSDPGRMMNHQMARLVSNYWGHGAKYIRSILERYHLRTLEALPSGNQRQTFWDHDSRRVGLRRNFDGSFGGWDGGFGPGEIP